MAVNSLFSAVDVADGTLELKHALVQAGVSAVRSFAGGALGTGALSSSLISQGTSTAFSGIDYEEGGGIGWSNDNFTAGLKSGLVNMAITAATHSDNASMWQKAGSSFASSYAGTAFDYNSDGFKIGWNEGAGERALVAGAAATTASSYAGLSDMNAKPAKDFDYSNSFTTGGYLDKMMTNTIESGAMSFYDMARHDLSWSDSSKQNGFYSGMIYQTGDIGGFLGDRASVKVKSNYEEYRDQRAKEQQQERAGLPTDAEDPFNGAEEMLFGLMDGLKRTEESFGNLFSGDGFNTDADLNNMDWETYDGYMKTTETGGADLAEYLQAKMRTGQELSYPEKQAVAQMAGSYGAGSMVAGFNGDYRHETDGQMAMLDKMGYDTEGLKGQVGQMRAVDSYNKAVRAAEEARNRPTVAPVAPEGDLPEPDNKYDNLFNNSGPTNFYELVKSNREKLLSNVQAIYDGKEDNSSNPSTLYKMVFDNNSKFQESLQQISTAGTKVNYTGAEVNKLIYGNIPTGEEYNNSRGIYFDYLDGLRKESKDLMLHWIKEDRSEVPLTPYAKEMMKDNFPNDFDLDSIRLINGGNVHSILNFLIGDNASAMCFGNNVYSFNELNVPGGFDQFKVRRDVRGIGLITHEVTHTVQQNNDTLGGFLERYIGEYQRSDNYDVPFGLRADIWKGRKRNITNSQYTNYEYKGSQLTYDQIAESNRFLMNYQYNKIKNERRRKK